MKLSINQSRKLWWAISAVAIITGIAAMLISWQQIGAPLRPSLDFVGGTRLQLERDCSQPNNCAQPIDITAVREVLAAQGLANSSIQILGQEQQGISIRTSTLDVEQRTQLQDALSQRIGAFDPQSTQIDTVGPTIGRQLLSSGLLALIVSFGGIIVYISLRFQLDFAVFAITALLHDVLFTAGVFAILGLVWGVEVDSLFIVALLTITGFSVNDTVVIYDRIREILKVNPDRSISEIVDDAVNQTLARSINTTLTTMLALFAIFLFGGETLKNFALALIIGFICGAYSSIFIASTLLSWWRERHGQRLATQSTAVIDSPPEDT
ncbi:protein translocase subunit SecF [Gloeocapsopsis sp. IPPAS B-1203]|uniref:protein translocase subunit SecF n=1 Tax=Gloeocapsopsis sp. IPPAS B-1203 TaxID=2049454 RepID=UPI000C174732|nr:protein translocase subunit SecF [Gloeocapsopsis sp. IPPAS B-1203]PIG94598.1 protein translocase subunit SecF [Gloeocapsopsis sp. IPPAS B-1203]